jgi:hypothetical protein
MYRTPLKKAIEYEHAEDRGVCEDVKIRRYPLISSYAECNEASCLYLVT